MSKQIYLPNMLTKQLGFFDEQNLDVQLIDEASGQSAEEEVLSGGVDAGLRARTTTPSRSRPRARG